MRDPDYDGNREFADKFLLPQRNILQMVCNIIQAPNVDIAVAPPYEDMKEATDMIITGDINKTVGLRVRRYMARPFKNDFTVRSRNGKAVTEYEKIVNGGYMNWMLYGYQVAPGIHELGWWMLIDIDLFRVAERNKHWSDSHPETVNDNPKTSFFSIDVRRYTGDHNIVLGTSEDIAYG